MREFELLCACARTTPGPDTEDIDWPKFLALARRHGLEALAYRNLEAGTIPEQIRNQLQQRYQANLLSNLVVAEQLVRLVADFEKAAIAGLAFKGPTLAVCAQGDLALRTFSDLDFLVAKPDIPRARELLLGLGYEELEDMPPHLERRSPFFSHFEFRRLANGTLVELHQLIVPEAFGFPTDFAALSRRSQRVALNGHEVPALGNEDLLLVLCVHAAKHRWPTLGMVGDVAALVRSHPEMDWSYVLEQADRTHTRRILLLGLLLAAELLGAPVPEMFRQRANADPAVVRLVGDIRRQLAADAGERGRWWFFLRFNLLVRERRWDGWRFCLRTIFSPTLADWEALRLPPPLSFLYPVFRPFRLLARHFLSR